MSNIVVAQAKKLAESFNIAGDEQELIQTLKATAFRGQVSDSQMAALMIVAGQYGLNPFTKEIYAFPDKNNGIVPVVGVDGWSRIINSNDQFDGMDFEQDNDSCTCKIFRKDRSHPIAVTEYLSECRRDVAPWRSHPKRMLRHKAMIQCARLAFGYVGIYDQDEAERIVEIELNDAPRRQTGQQAAEAAKVVQLSPEQTEARLKLIADLEIVASEQGITAYESAFKGLTAQQRKLIGADEHSRLKKIAEAIQGEAQTVEGEANE